MRAVPGPWLALALLLTAASAAMGAALTETGRKAYDMARNADEGAVAASEEGEKLLAQEKGLLEPERGAGPNDETLKGFGEDADAAHQALVAYRKLAQASATEAFQLLAEATRVGGAATPDPIRRDVLEQRALLAAHEAAVMAARARAEAERLRAILAETRLAGVTGRRPDPGRAAGGRAAGPEPAAAPGREVEVPNLVGARFAAAVRDLEAAGLRLGGSVGPRDGFVVQQAPEAGTRVARQTAVSITLSASAVKTNSGSP